MQIMLKPEREALLRALDIRAPRYTSYPSADKFTSSFGPAQYREHLREIDPSRQGPLSLYVHLPFCQSLCYFCGCNKVVTHDYSKAKPYLARVERELDLTLDNISGRPQVSQMHWGGGTPTFLKAAEIRSLLSGMRRRLEFLDDGEYSIEIDPRAIDDGQMQALIEGGINRMSLGVQDFNSEVQHAVNRIQPIEMTERVVSLARAAGVKSLSFDLIYGLPHQTRERFEATMQAVLTMRPERLALYNYAHLPNMFKAQRLINDDDLPSADEKLAIFQMATQWLEQAGYVYIGMDHFALPEDELAVALSTGRLHRNFQGYSTRADCDLIALGASAISKLGRCYSQNHRSVRDYYAAIDRGDLPVFRGLALSDDDLLRRDIIMGLMCEGKLDKQAVSKAHAIEFDHYFKESLSALEQYEDLGLVSAAPNEIVVTEEGRRKAMRVIASAFDSRQGQSVETSRYSKAL
ncbi:MAG: oxygen-independent coproporphyrinogen III oxidase [Burkholderiaceae bacterium]